MSEPTVAAAGPSLAAAAASQRPQAAAIPHILHQTWRDTQIPRGLRQAVSSWRSLQPQWAYRFHSDADNARLISSRFQFLLPAFRSMSGIQRADVARYAYMHAYGGVYADLDMRLLQPLHPLLRRLQQRNASVVLGQEPLAHSVLLEGRPRQVCNAVIASAPGHPFWSFVLRLIAKSATRLSDSDPVGSTGPRMLERAVDLWRAKHGGATSHRHVGGVLVVEPDIFYPTWDRMACPSIRRPSLRRHIQRPPHPTGSTSSGPTFTPMPRIPRSQRCKPASCALAALLRVLRCPGGRRPLSSRLFATAPARACAPRGSIRRYHEAARSPTTCGRTCGSQAPKK